MNVSARPDPSSSPSEGSDSETMFHHNLQLHLLVELQFQGDVVAANCQDDPQLPGMRLWSECACACCPLEGSCDIP